MSSARQDKIISNNWGMPREGSTQIAYTLSFPNDSSHLQQQFCAPDLTPRFQQSGSTSFNQALEGDQMSTSLIPDMTSRLGHSSYTLFNQALEPDQMSQSLFAPNSLLQSEQNHPHDPRSTTWFHERDTPPVNHYSSNHTTSLPHDKHRYTATREGKAQGSSTNTRRRRKREVNNEKAPPHIFLCEWKDCDRPGPFTCKASLKRHVNTQHIDSRSVSCRHESCPEVFNREDNMMQHFRSVHSVTL